MVWCDYFSASDDEEALRVLDKRGGPDATTFDVVSLKGVDPVVALARLEAILTGCGYDEAAGLPRTGQILSSPDAESAFIVRLSDILQEALASSPHASLVAAAGPWSETDELRQQGVAADAALDALVRIAGLASRARAAGRRLYCCWTL